MVRVSPQKKKPAKKKPGLGRTVRRMLTLRSRSKKPKPKRRKTMTTTTKDDDKKPEAKKGKEADPMATPPDTVYAPSQLPSDLDPEAGKEKKEK
jgi:hypothetical protein